MALNRKVNKRAYGFDESLLGVPGAPIVAQRAPSTADKAPIGTLWVDQSAPASYVLTLISANVATWTSTATSATVAGNFSQSGGTFTVASGTNAINISADAAATTLNIGTGAGDKDVTIGSVTAGSTLTLQAADDSTGITLSSGGVVVMDPDIATVAHPTAATTQDFNVIRCIFTGFTTAMGASQAFTVNSNEIIATSGVFVQVTNIDASTNGAYLTIDGVIQAVGSLVINCTNNGAGALGAGDNVIVTVWIIS